MLILLGLGILLACAGSAYQAVGYWRDTRRFSQRGRSVQAGQIKMNIDCSGRGSPTVILEQGGGIPATGWMKIQPQIAQFTRVCSYDRAGYGWSDDGPMPRTISRMAKELKALLDASQEQGPYVIAAASLGGPITRLYTGYYPQDVVGLVLVDASHEDQQQRVQRVQPPELIAENNKETAQYQRKQRLWGPFRRFFGIARFQVHFTAQSPQMPRRFWEEFFYLRQRSRYQQTLDSEVQSLPESSAELRTLSDLGDRPLIVLTAGKMIFTPEPFLTKEIEDKIRNTWINELQVEQAHLSTRGKQIIIPDSGHVIMWERPDAVIAAIREVWNAVQSKR